MIVTGRQDAHPFQLAVEGYAPWHERAAILAKPEGMDLFLRYVQSTVPYYSGLIATGHLSLSDFPLITKRNLVANCAQFVAHPVDEKLQLFSTTSGTTGPVLEIRIDLATWYDENCASYATVFAIIPGLTGFLHPGKLAVALVTNKPGRERLAIPLPSLKFGVFERFPIGESVNNHLDTLQYLSHACVPVLYGKPTYLLELLELSGQHPELKIQPQAILTSGENLFRDVRARLETHFGCKVYDAYISTEGGLMALECPYHTGLHVQTNRVVLEVLQLNGEVTTQGYGEILLTNLVNWTTAIVRYRTGDFGSLALAECPCGFKGPTFKELQGREARCFAVGDSLCSADSLDEILLQFPLKEFQMEQEESSAFVFRWVPKDDVKTDPGLERQMLSALASVLGCVSVRSSRQERITLPGGKVRRYIPFSGKLDPVPFS